jgi:hypothetical protein
VFGATVELESIAKTLNHKLWRRWRGHESWSATAAVVGGEIEEDQRRKKEKRAIVVVGGGECVFLLFTWFCWNSIKEWVGVRFEFNWEWGRQI